MKFMKYILIGIFVCISFELNAQDSMKNIHNSKIEIQKKLENLEKISNDLQELKTENAVLKKSVDTLEILFIGFGGLISLILIAGSVTSLISWNTERKRSTDTYNLTLNKEKELNGRDRTIFTQSSETLNLVNQTLELARVASERASKSLKNKLDSTHLELEQLASDLIDESKAYKNYKVLVENATFRSDLETLNMEIAQLQTNQKMLEDNVPLKPFCSFIRGMHFHLGQHFKEAIKYWKLVKDDKEATPQLKIMALYWIGYEQNNTMDFDNATITFENAAILADKELKDDALKYELERMKIESKSFNDSKFEPESLLPEIESLFKRIQNSDEFRKAKSKILGTLGNICLQIANKYRKNNDETISKQHYEKAKNSFLSAPEKDKWIRFGLGESLYRLKEQKEAEDIFRNVFNEATEEYSARIEPRTKVLGQTTVLICLMWIEDKKLNDQVGPIHNSLTTQTIGPVDERLSVYSQVQRRNVSKKQFFEDIKELMDEFRPVNV